MQKKLATNLAGIAFLVLAASMAFQGFEQKAFADVMMSNVTVSCGLHCVMKPVVQPVGKVAPVVSGSISVVHPIKGGTCPYAECPDTAAHSGKPIGK